MDKIQEGVKQKTTTSNTKDEKEDDSWGDDDSVSDHEKKEEIWKTAVSQKFLEVFGAEKGSPKQSVPVSTSKVSDPEENSQILKPELSILNQLLPTLKLNGQSSSTKTKTEAKSTSKPSPKSTNDEDNSWSVSEAENKDDAVSEVPPTTVKNKDDTKNDLESLFSSKYKSNDNPFLLGSKKSPTGSINSKWSSTSSLNSDHRHHPNPLLNVEKNIPIENKPSSSSSLNKIEIKADVIMHNVQEKGNPNVDWSSSDDDNTSVVDFNPQQAPTVKKSWTNDDDTDNHDQGNREPPAPTLPEITIGDNLVVNDGRFLEAKAKESSSEDIVKLFSSNQKTTTIPTPMTPTITKEIASSSSEKNKASSKARIPFSILLLKNPKTLQKELEDRSKMHPPTTKSISLDNITTGELDLDKISRTGEQPGDLIKKKKKNFFSKLKGKLSFSKSAKKSQSTSTLNNSISTGSVVADTARSLQAPSSYQSSEELTPKSIGNNGGDEQEQVHDVVSYTQVTNVNNLDKPTPSTEDESYHQNSSHNHFNFKDDENIRLSSFLKPDPIEAKITEEKGNEDAYHDPIIDFIDQSELILKSCAEYNDDNMNFNNNTKIDNVESLLEDGHPSQGTSAGLRKILENQKNDSSWEPKPEVLNINGITPAPEVVLKEDIHTILDVQNTEVVHVNDDGVVLDVDVEPSFKGDTINDISVGKPIVLEISNGIVDTGQGDHNIKADEVQIQKMELTLDPLNIIPHRHIAADWGQTDEDLSMQSEIASFAVEPVPVIENVTTDDIHHDDNVAPTTATTTHHDDSPSLLPSPSIIDSYSNSNVQPLMPEEQEDQQPQPGIKIESDEQKLLDLFQQAYDIFDKRTRNMAKVDKLLEDAAKPSKISTRADDSGSVGDSASDKNIKELDNDDAEDTNHSTTNRRSMAPPVPRYCDVTDRDNPNIDAVGGMLEQISCMYKVLAGNSTVFQTNCSQFESQIDDLRAALEACQQAKLELEREIQRLESELMACRNCLEEECQARMSLEALVAQLRGQINDIDQQLCIVIAERDQLLSCIEDQNIQMDQFRNNFKTVDIEREEICREYAVAQDDWKRRAFDFEELQRALASCCAKVDDLTQEIGFLNAEINRLRRELDDVARERDELLRKLQFEKDKYAKEKALADEIIQKLKDQIACLESRQQESCRKFEAAIKQHHVELDRISGEKAQLQKALDDEKRLREDLERKLKDCEESKQQQQKEPEQDQAEPVMECPEEQYQQQISELQDNCEEFREAVERLEQDRNALNGLVRDMEHRYKKAENEKISMEHSMNLRITETMEEVNRLQTIINSQFADKKDLDRLNANYEIQLHEMKSKLEDQLEINRQLTSIETNAQIPNPKLNEVENQVEEFQKQIAVLNNSVEQYRKDIYRLEQERKSVEKDKKKLEEKLQMTDRETQTNQIPMPRLNEVENQVDEFQKQIAELNNSVEQYRNDIQRLELERKSIEKDKRKLEEKLQRADRENQSLQNMVSMKNTIENEVKNLKDVIKEQVLDRNANSTDLEQIKSHYQLQLQNQKSQYETQLKQINVQLKRQQNMESSPIQMQQQIQAQVHEILQLQQKVTDLNSTCDGYRNDIQRLQQERKLFERERKQMEDRYLRAESEKISLQNLVTMKNRIEHDVKQLKEVISRQLLERNDIDQVKANYEIQLLEMKSKFEAQLEMNRQLAEINEYLGKQSKDRDVINQIRDSHEAQLRKELSGVTASLKLDIEKMKKMVSERDEEISSLRKAIGILKSKYATEAQQKEELQKKVQILSSISQETFEEATTSHNNNTIITVKRNHDP